MTLFETITAVTWTPSFLIALGVAWFIPILFWSILGVSIHTKTKSRTHFMGQSSNFYWFYVASLIQLVLLLAGVVFPVWSLWIE